MIVETQHIELFSQNSKLELESGQILGPIQVAYETYGQLNSAKDNVILITHALSGDAHAAGKHSESDKKTGWWDLLIGPGKAFDTNKYYIISTNALGGCMGTTGPSSINPETNEPYGLTFPMFTIGDMVTLQKHLMDHLGITKLLAVAGGSMGGMQALKWAVKYPEFVQAVIPIATTTKLSAQSIAFDAVGRNAILRDENFNGGKYYQKNIYPSSGLAIARMVGHITYLSEEAMHEKFGRRLQNADDYSYDFESEFSVETYLDYQGGRFVDRFDANTYLYFTKAMDYFDLARSFDSLADALNQTQSQFLIISFDSDWLFPPNQSQDLVNALIQSGKDVSYCNIHCPYGHDSFLLESKVQGALISGFLEQVYKKHESGNAIEKSLPSPTTSDDKKSGSIFEGERIDHRQIERLIKPNSTVLDLGCGDGELMQHLQNHKNIHGMGVTLQEQDVVGSCQRGVNVVQFDLDEYLWHFGGQSYDYAVLSQTLQVVRRPEFVLKEMLRIGRQVIVSFPNFAYWSYRIQILFSGRAPIGKALPHTWFDKESVNYLSIKDFEEFVESRLNAHIIERIPLLSRSGKQRSFMPNLFADEAIFVISQQKRT